MAWLVPLVNFSPGISFMDIARPDQARKKRRKRLLLGFGAVALVCGVTLGLAQLKPAAPTVERASL